MMVNGREISHWVDLVAFENNKAYLRTGLVDALLTENGAMYDGRYAELIKGEPGKQYVDIDLLNSWISRSQDRYLQRVNQAKNAYYEISSRLENMKAETDDTYPYERRVIGIFKKPVLYRCEDGGISSMALMKTVFSHEQAKYICGWAEKYTVQTREVTGPKSGDFFDMGSSKVTGSSTQIEHHGGIREDEEYFYLKVKSEEQRELVLNTYGPELGIYMDPVSRINEGYNPDGSFIEKSLIYTISNKAIMPVEKSYPISITAERMQDLLSNRGNDKLQEYSRASKVGVLELVVAAVMMFPITCLLKAVDLVSLLSGKLSWILKYLLGLFPGLFNAKFWPVTKLFTYGGGLLKDTSADGQWIVAFWLAVPISIALGMSFLLWRKEADGPKDVFTRILLQIVMIPALLLVYPVAFIIYFPWTCYMISHQIIMRGMAKYDIRKRKKQILRIEKNRMESGNGGVR